MNETATDKVPTPENPSAPTDPRAAEVPAAQRSEPAEAQPAPDIEPAPRQEAESPAEPTRTPTPPPAVPPAPLPPLPPIPPASPPQRSTRLVRSRSDKMIGGVCGGLAKVLNVDPLILRLALVLATVLGFGAGVVLYVACWILMPEEDQPT